MRRTVIVSDVHLNQAHPDTDCDPRWMRYRRRDLHPDRDFVQLAGERRPHITLCGRNSVQIHERQRPLDFAEMQRRLEPHGPVRRNDYILKFFRDPYEMTLFPDGRAIIKGTTDTAIARSLYARYVGS